MSGKRQHSRLPGIALFCACIGIVAGCGASSQPKITTQQARPTAVQSNPDVGTAYAQSGHARHRATGSSTAKNGAVQTKPTVQRVRQTPATSNDGENPKLRGQFNPCKLVSRPEAQGIVGRGIAGQVEAQLGPTCIYKVQGSQTAVTLTVESMSLSQVTRQMMKPRTLSLGNHRAYCGRLGKEMLFAPLPGGRILNVTAPCAIAQRFAALALPRLAA